MEEAWKTKVGSTANLNLEARPLAKRSAWISPVFAAI